MSQCFFLTFTVICRKWDELFHNYKLQDWMLGEPFIDGVWVSGGGRSKNTIQWKSLILFGTFVSLQLNFQRIWTVSRFRNNVEVQRYNKYYLRELLLVFVPQNGMFRVRVKINNGILLSGSCFVCRFCVLKETELSWEKYKRGFTLTWSEDPTLCHRVQRNERFTLEL